MISQSIERNEKDLVRSNVNELVRRTQSGDMDAFGELYNVFQPRILRYCLRLTRNNLDAAEDLTSNAFERALTKINTYQDRGVPFSAWLHRVTRNLHIDGIRRGGTVVFVPTDLVSPRDLYRQDSQSPASKDKTEVMFDLDQALDTLTPKQREVVELRYCWDLKIAETAEVANMAESAVKKLQERGLANLKKFYEKPSLSAERNGVS